MRLQAIDCLVQRECFSSQSAAGRHNPARVAKFNGRRHVLPIGDSDDWQLYRVPGDDTVYCVSINRRYGYCGVQGYRPTDQEPDDCLTVFFQEPDKELIGDIDELTDRTIARRLIGVLCEMAC